MSDLVTLGIVVDSSQVKGAKPRSPPLYTLSGQKVLSLNRLVRVYQEGWRND